MGSTNQMEQATPQFVLLHARSSHICWEHLCRVGCRIRVLVPEKEKKKGPLLAKRKEGKKMRKSQKDVINRSL
jgi:hypothetical protein